LLQEKGVKRMKNVRLLAAGLMLMMLLPVSGCFQKQDGENTAGDVGYNQISQEEAAKMMEEDDGHIIVDVRTWEEYQISHIPGAICIPNESITDEMPEELTDPNQVILVYCRSGRRSKEASEKLARLGYSQIYEFGGIQDWAGDVVSEDASR
jgi:rhodanese-related sulfurtransferase